MEIGGCPQAFEGAGPPLADGRHEVQANRASAEAEGDVVGFQIDDVCPQRFH